MTLRPFALAAFAFALSAPAFGQELVLPRPSPNAKLTQTVGLTDITVEYSAPTVKGRKIWGDLVPYDKMWRAGANSATKVTFSKDVKIVGKPIPAGSYSFFAIPTKKTWTIVFNKEANQPGTGTSYKPEQDILRVVVTPTAAPMRERLGYQILDFTDSKANLTLEWEKLRVAVPVELDTEAQVAANIQAYGADTWRPYSNAARYMLETKKDYDAGLALVEKSLAIKEDWLNVWTKAQLLAAKGKYKEAYPLAQKANDLGSKGSGFFFADDVKKALVDWKNK
jgi:hypothetical protein